MSVITFLPSRFTTGPVGCATSPSRGGAALRSCDLPVVTSETLRPRNLTTLEIVFALRRIFG